MTSRRVRARCRPGREWNVVIADTSAHARADFYLVAGMQSLPSQRSKLQDAARSNVDESTSRALRATVLSMALVPSKVDFAPGHDERCLKQRQANEEAARRGAPLPYPNPWDALDPTKVDPGATAEELARSYREFRKRCPPPRTKRYTI